MNKISFDVFLVKIDLSNKIIERVNLNLELFKSNYLSIYKNMIDTKDFELIKAKLNDYDGIKLLTIYLLKAYDDLTLYLKLNIDLNIYFDTFKCFSRFLKETYLATNKLIFDRYFWTYKQTELSLFKIKELEYEIDLINKEISIHIPSNANLKLDIVLDSLKSSYLFFKEHFKEVSEYKYTCSSWLLGKELVNLLNKNSNILRFQSLFNIVNTYIDNKDLYFFVFNTYNKDVTSFKEETSLQKKLKKYLLINRDYYSSKGILNIDLKGV